MSEMCQELYYILMIGPHKNVPCSEAIGGKISRHLEDAVGQITCMLCILVKLSLHPSCSVFMEYSTFHCPLSTFQFPVSSFSLLRCSNFMHSASPLLPKIGQLPRISKSMAKIRTIIMLCRYAIGFCRSNLIIPPSFPMFVLQSVICSTFDPFSCPLHSTSVTIFPYLHVSGWE